MNLETKRFLMGLITEEVKCAKLGQSVELRHNWLLLQIATAADPKHDPIRRRFLAAKKLRRVRGDGKQFVVAKDLVKAKGVKS